MTTTTLLDEIVSLILFCVLIRSNVPFLEIKYCTSIEERRLALGYAKQVHIKFMEVWTAFRTVDMFSIFTIFIEIFEEWFWKFVLIKFSSIGIVFDLTLYTVPLYKTLAHNYPVPDDVLTNGVAANWAKTTDQISLYWFPSFKEVVVANWTIVDSNTPGNAWTNDHVPPTYDNFNVLTGVIKEIAFGLTSNTCALANSLGTKYDLLAYIC